MGCPEEASRFAGEMKFGGTVISDPLRLLYGAFGLGRGTVGQMFSLRTFKRGFEATRAGHKVGRPVGDPWQLAGTVVIDRSGEVVWTHRSSDASDNATPEAIQEAISRAGSARSSSSPEGR